MTNKGAVYVQVLEKITTLTKALVDSNNVKRFKTVLEGWKTPAKAFPMAFVAPHPFPIVPATGAKSVYTFTYLVIVITVDAKLVTGMKKAINLSGYVEDALTTDRTLGGLIDNLEVSRYEIEWESSKGYLRHYVTLVIECRKLI